MVLRLGMLEERRLWAGCALALMLLLTTACDSSPTAPDQVLAFEGTLAFQSQVEHTFQTSTAGTTRIVLTDVSPVLVDVSGLGFSDPTLGFALGRRENGACETTAVLTISEGQERLFGLIEGAEYCVILSDPGVLPEDALIRYAMIVELP